MQLDREELRFQMVLRGWKAHQGKDQSYLFTRHYPWEPDRPDGVLYVQQAASELEVMLLGVEALHELKNQEARRALMILPDHHSTLLADYCQAYWIDRTPSARFQLEALLEAIRQTHNLHHDKEAFRRQVAHCKKQLEP